MTLSTAAAAAAQRTSDPQGFVELLTITGGDIAEPVRLVNDTRDFVSDGEDYIALPFEVVLPKDAPKEVPRATLRIDNVGRELTAILEALPPGAELMAKVAVVYRATPNVESYSFTSPLSGVRVNVLSVSATFGAGDTMRRPVTNIRFDPTTAPGLFPD